jgi:anti-sigma factor RsiW
VSPRDLACRELVELITDFIEGALPPDDMAVVEAHLAECDGCDRYLAQMRATMRVLGTAAVVTLPDEAVDSLMAAFARHNSRGGR